MQTAVLILVAVLFPLVWGWAMHRLLLLIWPPRKSGETDRHSPTRDASPPIDYQI